MTSYLEKGDVGIQFFLRRVEGISFKKHSPLSDDSERGELSMMWVQLEHLLGIYAFFAQLGELFYHFGAVFGIGHAKPF